MDMERPLVDAVPRYAPRPKGRTVRTVEPPITKISDPVRFILAETRILPVPHAPELRLHLADEAVELWQRTETELEVLGLPPPYWAFAWAGGQALARYLLDNPAVVRGRTVLDFGSGSGVVAIAAAKAGAARVVAAEIDTFSRTAIGLNALLNGVIVDLAEGDVLMTPAPGFDVILAGDMCYERPLAGQVITWLRACMAGGATVFLGDPGRAYLPKGELKALATYTIPTTRALEDAETKRTSVWTFV